MWVHSDLIESYLPHLSHVELRTYVALACYAEGNDGPEPPKGDVTAHVEQDVLAAIVGCREVQIERALLKLAGLGLVVRVGGRGFKLRLPPPPLTRFNRKEVSR